MLSFTITWADAMVFFSTSERTNSKSVKVASLTELHFVSSTLKHQLDSALITLSVFLLPRKIGYFSVITTWEMEATLH